MGEITVIIYHSTSSNIRRASSQTLGDTALIGADKARGSACSSSLGRLSTAITPGAGGGLPSEFFQLHHAGGVGTVSASPATQMTSARTFLKDLREEIQHHPGVGHSLLGRMLTDPRTKHDFRVLASQHYPLVANFTVYMELLLLRAPTFEAKCWIAKVLVDEYGDRSAGADHPQAYRTFMHAAGIEPGTEGDFPLHPEVLSFIEEHYRICTEEPFLVGLGAVGPGHEWSIPTMFEHVITGLHKAGFNNSEIDYWLMHLDQDADHGAWLEEALAEYCDTDEAREQIHRGALLSLNAREKFWWGVMDKMNTELTKTTLPGLASAMLGTGDTQATFNQVHDSLAIQISLGRNSSGIGTEAALSV